MHKSIIIIISLMVSLFPLHGQTGAPQKQGVTQQKNNGSDGDYGMPLRLGGKPLFSANFGELRASNMHAGMDFKTGGVEGVPVLASKAGYICRISVRPSGYGRALYMAHPDGTMTVYGHLSRFDNALEAYLTSSRYSKQTSNIELYPEAGRFVYGRGEQIGYSGNTGRSYGPHLHFEIRDQLTGSTVNPAKRAGFGTDDTLAPEPHKLYYYSVDTLSGVPLHKRLMEMSVTKDTQGIYRIASGALTAAGGVMLGNKGYFALEMVDRKNSVSNTMAVYRVDMVVDGESRFEYRMDGFTFADGACYSAVALSELNHRSSRYDVLRLAVMPRVKLPFYGKVVAGGLIDPAEDREVEIILEDDSGNSSRLQLEIIHTPSAHRQPAAVPSRAEKVEWDKAFTKTTGSLKVVIPAKSLYEPIFYEQFMIPDSVSVRTDRTPSVKVLSPFYRVGDSSIPLKSAIELEIRDEIGAEYRSRAVLARSNGNGGLVYCGGKWADGALKGKSGSFGTFCAVADTKSPSVDATFGSGADMSGAKAVVFNVGDDFSGIASFRAEVDGRWAILEYDIVRGRLTHNFDDSVFGRSKTHEIVVTVTDGAGNRSSEFATYYR